MTHRGSIHRHAIALTSAACNRRIGTRRAERRLDERKHRHAAHDDEHGRIDSGIARRHVEELRREPTAERRRDGRRRDVDVPRSGNERRVDIHDQTYTFGRGHQIMVQVQSTWFPLYDRNPQTFVPNIFKAKPSDYRAETHRVFRSAAHASNVKVMVLP